MIATQLLECEKERKTYKFSELSKGDQDRLIDIHRDINVDFDQWHEPILDEWKEKLADQGFIEAEIWYRGFSSQGDGACFDCKDVDIEKFIAANKVEMICMFFPRMDILRQVSEILSMHIVVRDTYYSHEKTRQMDFSWDTPGNDYPGFEEWIDSEKGSGTVKAFEEFVEAKRLDLCKDIYRSLEADYNYQTSDETVKETLDAQDWEYDENGDEI